MTLIKVFGAPGCGKTEYLLRQIENHFEEGLDIKDFSYFTFMKSQREDAKLRFAEKFGKRPEEFEPNVRTIHAMCFSLLGITSESVVTDDDREFFCEKTGIKYNVGGRKKIMVDVENADIEDLIKIKTEGEIGNVMFSFYDFIRHAFLADIKTIDMEKIMSYWINSKFSKGNDFSIFKGHIVSFMHNWEQWKEANGKMDFTDMLFRVYTDKKRINKKIISFDEFQDFTPLMYGVFKIWSENADIIYVAGDDDQTIFSYSGANPSIILNIKADKEIILEKTWRLPKNILSMSQNFIHKNISRKPKIISSDKQDGQIRFYCETLDSTIDRILDRKSWMLFRTRKYMKDCAQRLEERNIPYGLLKSENIWTHKSKSIINLNNALFKIKVSGDNLTYEELKCLIKSLNTKYYVVSGIKNKIKNGEIEERNYSIDEINFFLKENILLDRWEFIVNAMLASVSKRKKEMLIGRKNKGIIEEIKIFLSTIHTSKGQENADIYLFTNMPKIIYKEIYSSADRKILEEERRIFYTGCTRAAENIFIINCIDDGFYDGGMFFNELVEACQYAK